MSKWPIDTKIHYASVDNMPTLLDYMNAHKYASNKIQKEICKKYSYFYDWNENSETSYFCPEGLNCDEGNATFTSVGCNQASQLDYEDCKRDKNGILCDYGNGNWIPPVSTTGGISGAVINSSGICKKNKNPCKYDSDCKKDDKCVIPNNPYLEWYDKDIRLGSDVIQGKKCYYVPSFFKKWSEMPWTRNPSPNPDINCNPNSNEKGCPDAFGKINGYPKTTNVPPYFYDNTEGKSYTTKTYCNNFNQEFGDNNNYLLFNACTNKTDAIIDKSKDCCNTWGTSISEMFFGKTITDCIDNPNKCISRLDEKLIDFYCDRNLKKDIILIKSNFLPNINIYLFEWNEIANKLYGFRGKSIGFMSDEIQKIYPSEIKKDKNGYNYLFYNSEKCKSDITFNKICVMLKNKKFIDKLINNI